MFASWIIIGFVIIILIFFLLQIKRGTGQTFNQSTLNHGTEEISFEAGYLSPYMRMNKHKEEAILENALVLLVDQDVAKVQDIVPILEEIVTKQQVLFIIVKGIEEEVLSTLLVNKLHGQLTSIVVKASSSADERERLLGKIARLTNGQVIKGNMKLSKAKISQLGIARKVIVDETSTRVIG